MKFYLTLSVMFLVMINAALGAVGDVGVSDTAAIIQPEQSTFAGMDTNSYQDYSLNQNSAYTAPQISGPMQEQMTAEKLGLSQPQMESFSPDASLGFVSASQPVDTSQAMSAPVQSSVRLPSLWRSLQFRLHCPVPASGIIPVPWFPPTGSLSRPHPALERWEDAAIEAICPFGRISNQAATSLSMNGIPDRPPPRCDGGAGPGRAGKRVGFAVMSPAGISSATTAAYGPTTSTFMCIPEVLPYLRHQATHHQATQILRQA